MKFIIILFCLTLPFLLCSNPGIAQLKSDRNPDHDVNYIPTDYDSSAYKDEVKETVHNLRMYLEGKDIQIADAEKKKLRMIYEISDNIIDTNLANGYLELVPPENTEIDETKEINGQIKRYLEELGYGVEALNSKTIQDLSFITNRIKQKRNIVVFDNNSINILTKSISNINKDINRAHSRIDYLYSKLYDEAHFRVLITCIFSCCVGVLLLLFFASINRKDMSKDMSHFLTSGNGLQFITLFSLIIAIILFGVLGVLEGKELAAILSGISGYILGKGITPLKQNTEKPPPELKNDN